MTQLVQERGPAAAARELGISRHAAVAVAAGLDVMPGTAALLRERAAKSDPKKAA
ncbi:MAG TPA: hypothetical protein VGJ84_10160 [Polyangiaceae bacterium]